MSSSQGSSSKWGQSHRGERDLTGVGVGVGVGVRQGGGTVHSESTAAHVQSHRPVLHETHTHAYVQSYVLPKVNNCY